MSQQSTFQILHKHFNEPVCSRWFLVGLFIGIAAWVWGRSPLPALALKIASGFGGLLASVLGVVLVLAVTALLTKNRARYLAYGYFQKVLPWVLGKLLRATSVFFGLIVAAQSAGDALVAVMRLRPSFTAWYWAACWRTAGADWWSFLMIWKSEHDRSYPAISCPLLHHALSEPT